MRICYVAVVFTSIIYVINGFELPWTFLAVRESDVLIQFITFPHPLNVIGSIFLQVTLVTDECKVNKYAFMPGNATYTTLNFKKLIKPGNIVRVQALVESNRNITTHTLIFRINGFGRGELVNDPRSFGLQSTCRSQSTVSVVNKADAEPIFEDNFDSSQDLRDKWTHEVRYRNIGDYKEFVAFVPDLINSNITNDMLHITMTAGNRRGNYPLVGCTGKKTNANSKAECGVDKKHRTRRVTRRSANLYSKFAFKYGRIEIRAQMPRGDWIFPNIFLEPITEEKYKDQIRLYSRGNTILQDTNLLYFDGRSLFGSVVVWDKTNKEWKHSEYWTAKDVGGQYFWDALTDYTILWQPNKISFKVNGTFFGSITNPTLLERFNKTSRIVLGLTAGGKINFDDKVLMKQHKPFTNTQPRAEEIFIEEYNKQIKRTPLIIDHIRVYALDKSEQ